MREITDNTHVDTLDKLVEWIETCGMPTRQTPVSDTERASGRLVEYASVGLTVEIAADGEAAASREAVRYVAGALVMLFRASGRKRIGGWRLHPEIEIKENAVYIGCRVWLEPE